MRLRSTVCSALALSTLTLVTAHYQPARRFPQGDSDTLSSSSSSSNIASPPFTNSSTSSTSSTTSVATTDSSTEAPTLTDSAASTVCIDDVCFTLLPDPPVPSEDESDFPPAFTGTAPPTEDTSTASNCSGIIRLLSTPVTTITQTSTVEFTVTVTDPDQIITTPPIEYPLPPCTVILSTGTGRSPPAPDPPPIDMPFTGLTETVTEASGRGFTSTIIVIQKTPVVVTQFPTPSQYLPPAEPEEQVAPSVTPPPDFGGNTGPGSDSQNPGDQENPPSSNKNNQNDPGPSNGNGNAGNGSPGIGGIIPSIINNPWMPRPKPLPSGNNPSPGGDRGNPAPVDPSALISFIQKMKTAPAPTPAPAPASPAPTRPPGGNIPIIVAPSDVVIGNQLVSRPSGSVPPNVVAVNGQTFTVGATEVVGPYTTVLMGPPGASSVVVGGVTVHMAGTSQAVISGQTYSIGPSVAPTTIVVNGQTISIGPGGVGFPSTTLLPSGFSSTEIAGINIGIGGSQIVISGTTYDIGPSATPTTIVVDGQTISIGPSGVGFASTTLKGSSFSTTVVDGIIIGIGTSEVVISGTTYNIGPSATTTTIVVDGQTISIGPSGLGFASTTIPAAGVITATSYARTSSSNTLPSRTAVNPPAPAAENGASSSSDTLIGTVIALLIAGVVALSLS